MDTFPNTNEKTMIGHSPTDQYHSLPIYNPRLLEPQKPAYPWKNSSSATICPRCQELELDALLEKYSLFRERTLEYRDDSGQKPTLSMTEGILRTRASDTCQDHQVWQECALAITQRVLLDGKSSLDSTCPICSQIGHSEWSFKLYPVCRLGSEMYGDETSERGAVRFFFFDISTLYGASIIPEHLHGSEIYGPPITRVGNSVDFALVSSWLKQCEMEHSTCTRSQRFSPDRLKRVRLLDVHRRILSVYTPDKQFVALSYLWGGKEQPIVHAHGPVPQKFPLTIEHAILAVQKLDYQFLWVDSICIDQSDPTDKDAQIGNMDVIYSAASVTLILLDSPHADSGIPRVFPDEDRGLFPSRQRVAYFSSPRQDKRSEMTALTVYGNHPTLSQEQLKSEWSKRAWTFQEALLSQCRIFFSKNQVFFSCAEMNCSEDHHAEFKQLGIDMVADWGKKSLETLLYNADIREVEEDLYKYAAMIGNYVPRQLSDQEDGLRAISGVLSAWEAKLSCKKFVYGLPGWALRMGLLWYNGEAMYSQIIRRESTSLPSWSWCGWQWSDRDEIYVTPYRQYSNLVPPLFISHNGNTLVSNCGDSQDMKEPDFGSKTAHAHEETVQKLFEDVAKHDTEYRTRFHDQQVIINRPTLLTVRGILLKLSLEEEVTTNGSERRYYASQYQMIDAKPHGFIGKHQANRHDCVLLNFCTVTDVDEKQYLLETILLLWENSDDDMMPKVAKRAGKIICTIHVDDFSEKWRSLNPRWERFFFA